MLRPQPVVHTRTRFPTREGQSAAGFLLSAGYDSGSEETLLATLQSISVAELETLVPLQLLRCMTAQRAAYRVPFRPVPFQRATAVEQEGLEGLCASELIAAS